jgi:hypothetical protein
MAHLGEKPRRLNGMERRKKEAEAESKKIWSID